MDSLSGAEDMITRAYRPRGRQKLTKRRIAGLTPADGSVIMDTEMRGFGVRILPSGKRLYVAQYRVSGSRSSLNARRVTLGSVEHLELETARSMAKDILGRVARGEDPARDRAEWRQAPTVADLAPEYLTSVKRDRKPTTHYEYDRQMRKDVLPILGKLRVRDVERQHVAAIKRLVSGRYAANRVLALTSAFFGWCEEHGYREAGTNPCRGVKRHREEARRRYLSPEEASRLGAAMRSALDAGASPYAVAAIKLLLFSGMREREALSLAWNSVDLERGIVNLVDAKTSERERTLTAPAIALLAELPRQEGNVHVFPGAKRGAHLQDIARTWNRIRRDAQLADFHLHDLRHSFASAAVSSGASLAVIGELLGHRSAQTTKRYAHLHDTARRAAAEKASGALSAWIGGSETPVTPLRIEARERA